MRNCVHSVIVFVFHAWFNHDDCSYTFATSMKEVLDLTTIIKPISSIENKLRRSVLFSVHDFIRNSTYYSSMSDRTVGCNWTSRCYDEVWGSADSGSELETLDGSSRRTSSSDGVCASWTPSSSSSSTCHSHGVGGVSDAESGRSTDGRLNATASDAMMRTRLTVNGTSSDGCHCGPTPAFHCLLSPLPPAKQHDISSWILEQFVANTLLPHLIQEETSHIWEASSNAYTRMQNLKAT